MPLNVQPSSRLSDLPHLCYEVHGARNTIFNLVSDRCTSVNAHYSEMEPPANGNIISAIGVKAVDQSGRCLEILVNLRTQCRAVIFSLNQTQVTDHFNAFGVSISKHGKNVRVAVPNCESMPLVMWVHCDRVRNQSMIKFTISRGVNLRPTSHGLLGETIGV